MSPLEIVLILSGLFIIIISCRRIDRSGDTSKQQPALIDMEEAYEEELKRFQGRMKEQLSELKEEIIVRTDDELSSLSNEKIMVVGEYSDQILEKIKHNHEEVVFLYNMLSEKEKELKAAVLAMNTPERNTREEALPVKTNAVEPERKRVTGIQQVQSQRTKVAVSPTPKEKQAEPKHAPLSEADQGNNNSQILSLYSKGKSVVEISKLLGLGQGEVKLVIDLFRGRN